jgi:hypothetical protein
MLTPRAVQGSPVTGEQHLRTATLNGAFEFLNITKATKQVSDLCNI